MAGGGEEAVDAGLFHGVVLGVAFALDGVEFLGALGFRDEVDVGVLGGKAELRGADFPGPVGVEPDVGVEVGVGGFVAEIGADEFLEVGSFFALGLRGGAVGGEDAGEWGHVAEAGQNGMKAEVGRCPGMKSVSGGNARGEGLAEALRGRCWRF